MSLRTAYQQGRLAAREAHQQLGASFEATRFQRGVEAAVRWASPRSFGADVLASDAMLVPVGLPGTTTDGRPLLHAAIGPAPLTDDQASVVETILELGPWSEARQLSVQQQRVALGMLNAGLLYAMGDPGLRFYRDDLVPVPMPGASLVRLESETDDEVLVVNPPGGERPGVRFPALAVLSAPFVDGTSTLEQVVRSAVSASLGLESSLPDGPPDRAQEVLTQTARLGLMALVQAGLFWIDIR